MPETGYASIPRRVLHDEALPAASKVVLLVLSSFVGSEDTAWPSHATIAQLAGISERSVRRHLKVLKEAKLITWHQQKSATGDLTSNIYRLLDPSGRGTARMAEGYGQKGREVRPERPEGAATVAPGTDTVAEERTSKNDQEPSSSEAAPPTADDQDDQPRPEVLELCDRLSKWIVHNGNRPPAVTKRWYRAMRLLLDTDGETVAEVRRIIDWSQRDRFWRGNILSAQKLREKFETLRARANAGDGKDSDKPTHRSPTKQEQCPKPGHSGWATNCAQCRADQLARKESA